MYVVLKVEASPKWCFDPFATKNNLTWQSCLDYYRQQNIFWQCHVLIALLRESCPCLCSDLIFNFPSQQTSVCVLNKRLTKPVFIIKATTDTSTAPLTTSASASSATSRDSSTTASSTLGSEQLGEKLVAGLETGVWVWSIMGKTNLNHSEFESFQILCDWIQTQIWISAHLLIRLGHLPVISALHCCQ